MIFPWRSFILLESRNDLQFIEHALKWEALEVRSLLLISCMASGKSLKNTFFLKLATNVIAIAHEMEATIDINIILTETHIIWISSS